MDVYELSRIPKDSDIYDIVELNADDVRRHIHECMKNLNKESVEDFILELSRRLNPEISYEELINILYSVKDYVY